MFLKASLKIAQRIRSGCGLRQVKLCRVDKKSLLYVIPSVNAERLKISNPHYRRIEGILPQKSTTALTVETAPNADSVSTRQFNATLSRKSVKCVDESGGPSSGVWYYRQLLLFLGEETEQLWNRILSTASLRWRRAMTG